VQNKQLATGSIAVSEVDLGPRPRHGGLPYLEGIMRTQISYFMSIFMVLLLTTACQGEDPASVSADPDDPAPAAPTEALTPTGAPSILHVPQGEAPTIDGTLSPGEWDGAATGLFADGSELFLMYGDGYLYLAIRSITPEMIAGNIFVDRGDEIAILHASAALGTALYAKAGDRWEQTQGFVWRCRRTGNGAAAQAERDAFLQEEHWAAANSRTGTPAELEYQIAVADETVRLAANILRSSNPDEKTAWPAGLDDDCIKPTPGGLPEASHFSPGKWATAGLPSLER